MAKYESFIAKRLMQQSKPLYDQIRRNILRVSNKAASKVASNNKKQLSSARNDCWIFSGYTFFSQTREGNLNEFLQHENQLKLPTIAVTGW